jgi:predicted transcriptional regulator
MKEKIIELRKKGYTVNEIVGELGCAKSTVSYHINNVGLGGVRDSFLSDINDDIINKIKEFRLLSKTYKEIREIVGVSEDKLIKICRLHGLNKPNNEVKRKSLKYEEVLEYYTRVKSLRLTSKYFSVSRETLRKILPDNIIEINKCNKNVKKTNSQAVIDWRKRKKIELVEYKGGCCEKCGYNKSISVLQFHHLDPTQKDFTISSKSYSLEKLKKEVDKCIMVCANCHLEIHEELRKK